MADLQDAAVGAGAADQIVSLGEIGGDRLLQKHVNALPEEEPGDLVMGADRHRDADRIDPSGAFSTRLRRVLIASVIGVSRFGLVAHNPTLPRTSAMTTRAAGRPPAPRERALAGGGATVELHHLQGHDPQGMLPGSTNQSSDAAARKSSKSAKPCAP